MPTFNDPRIEAIYVAGQARIDRMRAELKRDADGCLVLPFRCYGCDEWKANLCMMTGDGLPLCTDCFDGCVEAASPKVPAA